MSYFRQQKEILTSWGHETAMNLHASRETQTPIGWYVEQGMNSILVSTVC